MPSNGRAEGGKGKDGGGGGGGHPSVKGQYLTWVGGAITAKKGLYLELGLPS